MNFILLTKLPCLIWNGVILCVRGKRLRGTPEIYSRVLLGHDLGSHWWYRSPGTNGTVDVDEAVRRQISELHDYNLWQLSSKKRLSRVGYGGGGAWAMNCPLANIWSIFRNWTGH